MTGQHEKLIDPPAERDYLCSLVPGGEKWLPKYSLPLAAFTDSRHATIAQAIFELHRASVPIDPIELVDWLQHNGKLTQAGGEGYVLDLLGMARSSPPTTFRRLSELHQARGLRTSLMRAIHELETLAIANGVEVAKEAIASFVGPARSIEPIYEAAYASFSGLANPSKDMVPLGVKVVDDTIGGLTPGSLTIIGADTGVGKSSTALYLAHRLDTLGYHVGYVSCEDPRDVVGTRAIALRGNVSATGIRSRRLSSDELRNAAAGVEAWRESKVHIAYEIGSNDREVTSAMSRLVGEHGAKILYVDYIQTINPSQGTNTRREDVRRIASRIKSEAARLKVPVVLISQIARPREDQAGNPPGKHALKESGDLENMSELIVMLWRQGDGVHGRIVKSKWGGDGIMFRLVRAGHGMLIEA